MGLADIDKDLGLQAIDRDLSAPGMKMGGTFEGESNGPPLTGPKPNTASPYNLLPWLLQYHRQSKAIANQDPVYGTLENYVPSAATATGLTMPGFGKLLSLVGAGAVGSIRGGSSALSGEGNPLAEGAKGAIIQAAPTVATAIPGVARAAANLVPVLGSNLAQARTARAIESQTKALERVLASKGQNTPVPEPEWTKFAPTGIPGKLGTVGFQPPGTVTTPPVKPVEPAIVTHPELQGWTGVDRLRPTSQPSVPETSGFPGWGLLRKILGAAGNEAQERSQ